MEATSGDISLWCAVECRAAVEAMLPHVVFEPDLRLPDGVDATPDPEVAAARALRGHLDVVGPVTASALAVTTSLSVATVDIALARLEAEGYALRGSFDPTLDGEQWCARRLLVRIHGYTQQRLRREIEP